MIRFENISIGFAARRGERWAVLCGVDFEVGHSEFLCVLGPSGCGKSTLLNLAAGFLAPDTGRVLVDGSAVAGPGPDRGVVFQDPTLFPWLTVSANVAFGLRGKGLDQQQIQTRVRQALQLVGLDGFDDHYPHTLSGGMRQRAALARVLVLEPRALLMDEPFNALDANSRERLQDELLRIWELHRRTVLFVTHSVDEAVYLADRIVLIGSPPESVRGQFAVPLERPRERSGSALRELAASLRDRLNRLL
jgi:NitT/TauT family transport system ATP-binding protein